jgi:hypothetical protein
LCKVTSPFFECPGSIGEGKKGGRLVVVDDAAVADGDEEDRSEKKVETRKQRLEIGKGGGEGSLRERVRTVAVVPSSLPPPGEFDLK